MSERLPLSALLSQALVAFTIELDNEFERQMPHRTTRYGIGGPDPPVSRAGKPMRRPWLVSLAMWSNFMRFVGEEGVSVRELERQARVTKEWMQMALGGMTRWGYVVVEPDPADRRASPPPRDWLVRPTAAGRRAQKVWRPLPGAIEERWRARFGDAEISALREALADLAGQFEFELPEHLAAPRQPPEARVVGDVAAVSGLPLTALLAQPLIALTLDFEAESSLSLAVSANVIRVLDHAAMRVRDLPGLAGVSTETINNSLGRLEKRRYVVVGPDPAGSRARLARLTQRGHGARDNYYRLLELLEGRWADRFGNDSLGNVRASLETLGGDPAGQRSPLLIGLAPHPGGWRASARSPRTLPHYPEVSHRGGFPDGS